MTNAPQYFHQWKSLFDSWATGITEKVLQGEGAQATMGVHDDLVSQIEDSMPKFV